MNRRTLLVTAGWLGAAVLAALVGLAAISVIGNGLTSPETRPLSAAEVADELARQIPTSPSASAGSGSRPSPSSSVSSPTSSSSSSPSNAASQSFPTRAGTVVGRCVGSRPELVSMSPRQGYEVHDQDDDEGEFRNRADNDNRVKFEIVCRAGVPALTVEDRED